DLSALRDLDLPRAPVRAPPCRRGSGRGCRPGCVRGAPAGEGRERPVRSGGRGMTTTRPGLAELGQVASEAGPAPAATSQGGDRATLALERIAAALERISPGPAPAPDWRAAEAWG